MLNELVDLKTGCMVFLTLVMVVAVLVGTSYLFALLVMSLVGM